MKAVVDGLTDLLAGAPLDYAPDDRGDEPYIETHALWRGVIAAAITFAIVAAICWAGYGLWFAAGVLAAVWL
ncbi:hypothetical protein [Pseudaminobacter sp. NGMCC 1.201702]|uniref:hypothetical protein n=1 Tax=Pseudaminobacter sp. NGMCC 1.201702 TaxID=3391825 RepID=UPI0039EE5856